ncbi:hypothetical protein DFJ73DRAFT_845792 [Zopfochytrium polystomum]|nr:hypothetical protein DFJ73DRAFT_845792 [Zopfochytrium polystomum]
MMRLKQPQPNDSEAASNGTATTTATTTTGAAEQPKSQSTTDMESSRSRSELFVRGIPTNATNKDLEAFFSDVGPVRHCFVVGEGLAESAAESANGTKDTPRDGTVKNRGFGFVQFAIAEDAARALTELKTVKFMGVKPLLMELAIKRKVVKEAKASGQRISFAPEKRKPSEAPPKEAANSSATIPSSKKTKTVRRSTHTSAVILISNIPIGISRKSISHKVKKFGEVKSIEHPVSTSGSAARQAKVTFVQAESAETAITKLNNHIFKGEKITAAKWDPSELQKQPQLIIRNLAFDCTEAHIERALQKFGSISSINLPLRPPKPGSSARLCRGFAFVRMSTVAEAEAVVANVNGSKICGRLVAVDHAAGRSEFADQRTTEPSSDAADVSVNSSSDHDGGGGDEEYLELGATESADIEDDSASFDDEPERMNYEEESDGDANDSIEVEYDPELESSSKAATRTKTQANGNEDSTVFVRNIALDSSEEALKQKFSYFGRIRYALFTKDPVTGRPKGTAFVCFADVEDANKCLSDHKAAALSHILLEQSTLSGQEDANNPRKRAKVEGKKKAGMSSVGSSVLVPDPSVTSSVTSPFLLDGRFLDVTPALSRKDAALLAEQKRANERASDKRNMYLIREGLVLPESDAAVGVPVEELNKRQKSYTERKRLLDTNPNLMLSKVRLSVRNLDPMVSSLSLRRAAILAVKRFWEDVHQRARKGLEKEVMDEEIAQGRQVPGSSRKVMIKKCQIMHDTERKDATTGKPKSKGFGFIEFESHADALACLRWLNNNPFAFNSSGAATSLEELQALRKERLPEEGKARQAKSARRPIVEFAIENRLVLKKKAEDSNRQQQKRAEKLAKASTAENDEPKVPAKRKRKRDDINSGEQKEAKKGSKKRQKSVEEDEGQGEAREPAKGPQKRQKMSEPVVSSVKEQRTAKPMAESRKKKPAMSKAERRDLEEEKRFDSLVEKYGKGLFGSSGAPTASEPRVRNLSNSAISKWYS